MHWPTACEFHNSVLAQIKPLSRLGHLYHFCPLVWALNRAPSVCITGPGYCLLHFDLQKKFNGYNNLFYLRQVLPPDVMKTLDESL